MASDPDFVQYVADQFAEDCRVTYRKMFGEYGLYSRGTFFAVICDNRLHVKPTDDGRAHIGEPVMAPAYPGAKPSFLIEEGIDDGEWLSELARVTAAELDASPAGKRRRKKKKT